ncbi:cell envelope integrity inner membrane protein TolA [Serratia symbiotica str. 'Cinara cedri']|nr:cell envelope integrity inner membrane protein TolA [Serratia symbiotica str. 'Cinara cedri']
MVKVTAQNYNLNHAIIVSVGLHLILIILFIWGVPHKNIISAGSILNDPIVNALIIDPSSIDSMSEQYNNQVQQFNNTQRTEKLNQKKIQQKTEGPKQKQVLAQHHLKGLEKERLALQEKTIKSAKIVVEHKKLVKSAIIEGKDYEKNVKILTPPAKVEGNKVAIVMKDKNKLSIDTDHKVAGHATLAEQSDTKSSVSMSADFSRYIGQIRGAIQDKFYDPSLFRGKTCNLRIKLAPDGLLMSVQKLDGDSLLCQAAVSAVKSAEMPKPLNDTIYQHFKNFTLGFKPS